MAESPDPHLQRLDLGQPASNPFLTAPWSCLESSTEEVCGVPSAKMGCWRYHRIPKTCVPESKALGTHPLGNAVGPQGEPQGIDV